MSKISNACAEVRGKDWRKEHIGRISASVAPVLFGKGFITPLDLAIRMKKEIESGEVEEIENPLFAMGHCLEQLNFQLFLKKHPELEEVKGFGGDRLFRSKKNPLFQCTPDRICYNKETKEYELVELKYDCTGKYYFNSPEDYCMNEGYPIQVQTQMLVFDVIKKGHLSTLNNYGNQFDVPFKASSKLQEQILEKGTSFITDCVLGDKEPEIMSVEDTKICKQIDKPVVATQEIIDAINKLNSYEMSVKILHNNIGYKDKEFGFEALKSKVQIFMGGNNLLVDEYGNELATYSLGNWRTFKLK